MRRGRYISAPAVRRGRVRIGSFKAGADASADESTLSPDVSPDTYNFCFSRGVLTEGYGLADYDRLRGLAVSAVWRYVRTDPETDAADDRLMALAATGEVYEGPYAAAGPLTVLGGIRLSAPPAVTNYRLYGEDVVILCTAAEGMYVYNGADPPYLVEGAPCITSLTLHAERLFVTAGGARNAVWFSEDLDPTNFDLSLSGGGFIQLIDERGVSGRVVSFAGYVYVFREYGISRIGGYGDQREFTVASLFVSSGRIFFDSVQLCGDRILFLAEDGLYAFDGYNTVKTVKRLSDVFIDGTYAAAAFTAGRYYLSFSMDRRDGETLLDEASPYRNNGLLIYDLSSGAASLSRGMDIRRLTALKGGDGVLAVTGAGRAGLVVKNGRYFEAGLPKKWRVPKTDFALSGNKRLAAVHLFTRYPCTLRLFSDTGQRTLAVAGGQKPQRVRCNLSGVRLGLEILSGGGPAEIASVSLVVTGGGRD
ncbi:MAG: hypothetical protein LBH24_02195 [Clostridiales bacterium]|nr:hypothetical protein [Clostridiales bacterium]